MFKINISIYICVVPLKNEEMDSAAVGGSTNMNHLKQQGNETEVSIRGLYILFVSHCLI
jgi:hypothetical protein